jgi:hypothetical protein
VSVNEFVAEISGFPSATHPDKVKVFGWFLHAREGKERFSGEMLRRCYEKAHLPLPSNMSLLLKRLVEQKPPILLKDSGGYRLEARVRSELDKKYGESRPLVAVSRLLGELPSKVPTPVEQTFLNETLICFRYGAFRAAIVMAWNLAYHHLQSWLLADAGRLATFNQRIPIRYIKKANIAIADWPDFEELKESEVISIAVSAGLVSKNIGRVLDEKLTRRNMAAHPAAVVITQPQAEDVITDLVNNVVLQLL